MKSQSVLEGAFADLIRVTLREVVREELPKLLNGHAKPSVTKVAASVPEPKPVKAKAKAKPAAATPAPAAKGGGKGKFGEKSEFIRSMPGVPAAEVIAAAAKKGISLTATHVYNVRSASKTGGTGPVAKPAKAAPKAKAKAASKAPAKAKAEPKTAPKKAKAEPKAKAAPKAKPAKPTKEEGKGNISKGRRAVARGDRPKLVDSVAIVMGKEVMSAAEVIEGLKKRGWTPEASNLPAYISFVLSSNQEDVFERTGRGRYKVIHPEKYAKGAPSGKAERVASTTEDGNAEEPKAAEAKAPKAPKAPRAKAAKKTPATAEASAPATPASDPSPEPAKTTPPPAPVVEETRTAETLAGIGLGQSGVGDNPFSSSNSTQAQA